MSNFISVSTSAARLQDIPLNPQKLAGQCGKLKCCLNFEVDTYVEAQRKLPSREVILETKDSSYYHFKTDILSGTMTYSTDKNFAANLISLPKDRVFDVIRMNKRGDRPLHLAMESQEQTEKPTSHDILQENINRFDDNGNGNNRNNKKKKFVKNNKGENPRPVNTQQANSQSNSKPQINKVQGGNNNRSQQQAEANSQGNPNPNPNSNPNPNRNKNKNRHNRNRSNRNGNSEQKKPEA